MATNQQTQRRRAPRKKPTTGKGDAASAGAPTVTPPAPAGMEDPVDPRLPIEGDGSASDGDVVVERSELSDDEVRAEYERRFGGDDVVDPEAPIEPAERLARAYAGDEAKHDARLDQPHAELRLRLRHARGCPEGGSLDRVEAYPQRIPERQGGGQVIVVRCQECGAHAREDELD